RYGIDRLKTLGIHAGEILLTGGGVGSATWRQVVADVCDAPVTVLEQNEGASFGAALQALAVIEGAGSEGFQQLVDDHLSRDGKLCCEPSRPAVNQYEEAYGRYRDAVAAITPLYS
ncbi:MAG: xylulokinase, partial [Xanthomonadales bacterium]|nr:xylulokinase [Xanthomonadales bacterium]